MPTTRLKGKVTPRAAVIDSAALASGTAMRIAVGEANAALVAFLAKALGLKRAEIEIRSGETGRTKILHLSGESAEIRARLDAWIAKNAA